MPTKIVGVCASGTARSKRRYRPRHIRRALNKKKRLWRVYRKNKSLSTKSHYDEQSAYVK